MTWKQSAMRMTNRKEGKGTGQLTYCATPLPPGHPSPKHLSTSMTSSEAEMLECIVAVTPRIPSSLSLTPQNSHPLERIRTVTEMVGIEKVKRGQEALRKMGKRVGMMGRVAVRDSAINQCVATCAINSSVAGVAW